MIKTMKKFRKETNLKGKKIKNETFGGTFRPSS